MAVWILLFLHSSFPLTILLLGLLEPTLQASAPQLPHGKIQASKDLYLAPVSDRCRDMGLPGECQQFSRTALLPHCHPPSAPSCWMLGWPC